MFSGSKNKKANYKVDPDFINIAAHFNKNTLLTKNGELIQIIRIDGLSKEGRDSIGISLRDIIRDVMYDNLDGNNKFALWFHTIRRKKDITLRFSENHKENSLLQRIDDSWQEKNNWSSQFTNELYISVVSQSTSYWRSKNSKNSAFAMFRQGSLAKAEASALKVLSKEISIFTNQLLLELSEHGARLLGVREWDGQYFSEPMRFLGKIINLEERRYPVTFSDISHELSHSQIVFGSRDVQVSSKKNNNFCSILSLKEYVEIPLELMDKILSLDFEFIITQSFDLFFDKKDLDTYSDNLKIIKISEDIALEEVTGLSNYENIENKSKKDFGSLQTTITIITNEHEKIEPEISSALEEFGALGLVMVREDIFLEHCFWSRIPGNFSFIKRQKTIKTLQVPGFAAINSMPSGNFDGNLWGPAITTLPTILNTPYFFNFHEIDKSSCFVQGESRGDKDIFSNFVALQSLKADTNLFFIDSASSSDVITKCLKGNVFRFTNDENTTKLNPFQLQANEENIIATMNLINAMTKFIKGGLPEEEIFNCKQQIAEILGDKSTNFLIGFDKLRTDGTLAVYQKLKTWTQGNIAKYFSADQDISIDAKCNSFNLCEIMKSKPLVIAIFTHIFNKILDHAQSSSKRCVIVVDEPMNFFNNPFYENSFIDLIKRAEQLECAIIFKHSNELSARNIDLHQKISNSCLTNIVFPKRVEEDYSEDEYNIEEGELEALKYMTLHTQKNYILKRLGVPIILHNNIEQLSESEPLLSNDNISVLAANEITKENNQIDGHELVNQIIEVFNDYQESQKKQLIKSLKDQEEEDSE